MTALGRLVLDTSVALAWCFKDESNPYADKIAKRLPNIEMIVPGIWPLEVANALLMGERRKRSTQADTVLWTGFLATLTIIVDGETSDRPFGETLNLARTHNLSAYDAAYLELALRLGLPLATLDEKLKVAAGAVGVELFETS